jgi:putative copper export protein
MGKNALVDDSHTVAQSVHDLGAALWFGGSVTGVAGVKVNKSGADLRHGVDKVRVAESAWQRFAPVQWLGIGAVIVAGSRSRS